MRKSPDPPTPSPVNTRPVRLAPCAAGARPTRSSRARGSPNPGTGRAQYVSSRNARRFSRPMRWQYSRRRAQRSHETIAARTCSSRVIVPPRKLSTTEDAEDTEVQPDREQDSSSVSSRSARLQLRIPPGVQLVVGLQRDRRLADTSINVMRHVAPKDAAELDAIETREWLESLDYVLQSGGPAKVARLLRELTIHARQNGVRLPFTANTPYINTIPADEQVLMPGSPDVERRIKSLVRWNAAAMVVRANKAEAGIGGHISPFASAATLYEVGFNHFFRGRDESEDADGDVIFFQGHAAPGIYARAYLEGRIDESHLENFRRETRPGVGLSSYPHPWLMPDFWEYPTVSMGLGPIMAIYQARFTRYLEDRGLKQKSSAKVWAFLGDGETDEPESLGAITLPAREKLDNLIFVVNCNLQRLDGPVRGNGQIIQELEAAFRGAGWNVIKVLWGREWDPLLAKDRDGLLVKRMGEIVDGQYQKYAVSDGAYVREHFWGADPRLLDMVKHLSDDQLKKMTLGGHDPIKVFNAYKAATEYKGAPTVILARTIKGYGLREAGDGKNITHQQKKMNEDELLAFRTRFGIPISDENIAKTPFYRPAEDSDEAKYMRDRRQALGGYVPSRRTRTDALPALAS